VPLFFFSVKINSHIRYLFREALNNSSFPRTRESMLLLFRDTRFRGYDIFRVIQSFLRFLSTSTNPMPVFLSLDLPYFANSTLLFASFYKEPWAIFLDSCSDSRQEQGMDVIAASPILRFIASHKGAYYRIENEQGVLVEECTPSSPKPLERLLALEKEISGVLMGYLGYHCNDAAFFDAKNKGRIGFQSRSNPQEQVELPDIALGFYNWRIETCHKEKTTKLKYIKSIFKDDAVLTRLLHRIENQRSFALPLINNQLAESKKAQSNFSKPAYLQAFEKIQHYISEGDCYQVNLAQRFTLPFSGSSWEHYLYLRQQSPAPYACFFATPFGEILSFSPESFLRIDASGKIISQPIKGTRKRHADKQLDAQAAIELAHSKKDKAENLMIVDLLRNDLSKSAELNSVKVDKLFEIQSFANVHHMVSQVSAQKLSAKSVLEVLLNCFPGGSITGAPKKRAMEIIRELEPHKRQVYCGAIGHINFEGELDFNIAIRTLVISKGVLYCWGGGGLVADSEAEAEYQESITKISNLIPI